MFAVLLEQGRYLGSVSTFYRVLRADDQVKERRRLARHKPRQRPELVATGPGQVYSWDITKLKGPVKGVYYDAYGMIDIYSWLIVGVHVHNRENGLPAAEMMRRIFGVHGIPHVVHADRGTSMTSKDVAGLLDDLGVTRSHSRTKVSTDNPFSEAWFKTAKYSPAFPEHFADLAAAQAFMSDFVHWYNHCHHHSGIGLHTPADVHYGRHHAVTERLQQVLGQARTAHPERFTTSQPLPKVFDCPIRSGSINPNSRRKRQLPNSTSLGWWGLVRVGAGWCGLVALRAETEPGREEVLQLAEDGVETQFCPGPLGG